MKSIASKKQTGVADEMDCYVEALREEHRDMVREIIGLFPDSGRKLDLQGYLKVRVGLAEKVFGLEKLVLK